MFETAELGQTVPRKQFKRDATVLRQELLELQEELREVDQTQVVLVFAGVDGAGKSETVNLLNEWMDARWLQTRVFDDPTDIERERPTFWRYWLGLPPRGRIGLFLSSWYSQPVLDRVYGHIDDPQLDAQLDDIVSFETALAHDGAAVVKFWLHLSREQQKLRLESLAADPLTRSRVTERDWQHWELYDRFIGAAERVVSRTSTGQARWHIVEGLDANFRGLRIGSILRDTLRKRIEEVHVERELKAKLARKAPAEVNVKKPVTKDAPAPTAGPTILSDLPMNAALEKTVYRERLHELQARAHALHLDVREKGRPVLMVFEGPDAAGKGGAIRRVTAALDARNYQVHGFSAPTDEERAQHYLWRFWRRLPRAGRFSIFDRSWYGRVLVERVEGFAHDDEWGRAYAEIADFERQLVSHGAVLFKYWIHITADEQLKRFKQRERTPYKRWKLTDEDWRNRENWAAYEHAVHDMVQYTSTQSAPWVLVEGNDKRYARVKVLEVLCERLGEALG